MNLKLKKSPFRLSLIIALFIHITIIIIFNFLIIDENEESRSKSIYLEFKKYVKKENKEDVSLTKVKNSFGNSTNILKNPNPILIEEKFEDENAVVIIDSTVFAHNDTVKRYTNIIDSIIVNYPDLYTFKSLLKEMIRKNPIVESDTLKAIKGLKKSLIEYYKNKYPTPLSKFGEQNSGIPIDKILDFFSKDDTTDIKKIKEYLGLDKD